MFPAVIVVSILMFNDNKLHFAVAVIIVGVEQMHIAY